MSAEVAEVLCEPVLKLAGIPHGFGQRASQVPDSTTFPKQVHGTQVLAVDRPIGPLAIEADVVLSATPGMSVGIVTADCVPILAASRDARAVAAIHAGWRGLAAGVIEAGIDALRAAAGAPGLLCAIGPSARGCCYEVDDPVRKGLAERYARLLDEVLRPGRPGHYLLDLPLLATRIIQTIGVESTRIGIENRVCTLCDPGRFESYRRDGVSAGRLRHFISVPPAIPCQG